MNKGKKLLCVLLACILCLAPTFNVTAAQIPASQAIDADSAQTVSQMSTHIITTGSKSDFGKVKGYYVSVPATADTNSIGKYQTVVPMKITKKGILVTTFGFDNATHPTATTANVELYTDANCTNQVYASQKESIDSYKIKKAGTYYFKFTVMDSSSDGVTPYDFKFISQLEDASDRTLKNKAEVYSANIDTAGNIYYKVTASKTGSLTFKYDSSYGANVTLCNSKKQAISDKCYLSTSSPKVVFAVKKGTYYYRVNAYADYLYAKSTFTAITDKSGTSKAKPRQLVLGGKAINGVVLASDKKGKTDWFKFTLTKSKKVAINFKGSASSGEIKLVLFSNAIGGQTGTSIYHSEDENVVFYPKTILSDKLPKGTYYIKVIKNTSKTSGNYSLRVK